MVISNKISHKRCYSLLDLSQSQEDNQLNQPNEVRPVTAELEAGRRLNLERNRLPLRRETSTEVIKPLYMRQKLPRTDKSNRRCRKSLKQDPILWKLEFPVPPKPKMCHHCDNLIIDRQILTRSEHIDVLSRPRNSGHKKRSPKLVPRSIPPMTNRMNELAQPKKRDVILTWQRYAPILTGKQIDTFQGILASYQVMDNKRAAEYLKQCGKDERLRRKFQKMEVKKLRKDIERIYLDQIKDVILRVFNEVKGYLLGHQEFCLDPQMTQVSEKILKMICRFLKCQMPSGSTKKGQLKGRAMEMLADKITVWAQAFLGAAGYEKDVKDLEAERAESMESEIEGYPIDDFILDIEEGLLGMDEPYDDEDLHRPSDEDEDFLHEEEEDQDGEREQKEHDSETVMLVQTLVESLLGMAIPGHEDDFDDK